MKKQIKNTLPAISDDYGLAQFIRLAQSFPILSSTEEYDYATQFAKTRDRISADKLVSSHLRLVVSMAYELKDYGIPVGELIASGNVGLMQALQKFDPQKGFRFSTYAAFWIKAEMYDLILANWSLVKIGSGAAQKKLFFNLARAKRTLGIMDSRLSGEQVKQIAEKLDVPESDVEIMNTRMHFRDMSLNANKYDDGEVEVLDLVEDGKRPITEELEDREARHNNYELLQKHLSRLPERDREILTARRLADPVKTLETLSAEYGVSRERIRQIEERAFDKLKTLMIEDNE